MPEDDLPYDAIVIDTSIFEQYSLKLEDGYLGKLTQFKNSPVEFILPDIVVNEIKSHLDKKSHETYDALKKSIAEANKYLYFDGSPLSHLEYTLPKHDDIQHIGQARVDNFIENTDALILESEKYVSMNSLIQKYFSNQPPFNISGKKKNEFPDAIALMAIEQWAIKEGKNVIVITKDSDWKNFCAESSVLHYEEDLATGLAHFHKVNFKANLATAIINNEIENFEQELENFLEGELKGLILEQDADSIYYWEPEGVETSYQSFTLLAGDQDSIKIIDFIDDSITIKIPVSITIEATGHFSLSIHDSIDREFIPMGSQELTVEHEFQTDILITLSGDFKDFEDIKDLLIEEMEIITLPSYIHFGEISFDYWADV